MRCSTFFLLLMTSILAFGSDIDQAVVDAAVASMNSNDSSTQKAESDAGQTDWQPEAWRKTYAACDPDRPDNLWANKSVECVDGTPKVKELEPCDTCKRQPH